MIDSIMRAENSIIKNSINMLLFAVFIGGTRIFFFKQKLLIVNGYECFALTDEMYSMLEWVSLLYL